MPKKLRPYFDVLVKRDSGYDFEVHSYGHLPGPPIVAYFRRDSRGALVVAKLVIEPAPPAEGVTSAMLRDLQLGELMARVREAWQQWSTEPPPSGSRTRARGPRDDPEWREQDKKMAAHGAEMASAASKRTRGRPSLGDDHYRRIATAYLDLAYAGATRGILQRLAATEDRNVETVRDWVHTARKLGFLTAGQPGRAGAEPGPRLSDYVPPSPIAAKRKRGKR